LHFIGSFLASRLSEAIQERALHCAFFLKLSSSIDLETIEKWEKLVMAWEDDQIKPCPFTKVKKSVFNLCQAENIV
jgi:hypothetical protein